MVKKDISLKRMLKKWDLGQKSITKGKQRHYIMLKYSIQQLYIYMYLNTWPQNTKQKLTKLTKNRQIHNHSAKF